MDTVVPSSHMDRLAIAARAGKAARSDPAPVETVLVPGGQHSWLYEDAGYRRAVARFLTAALGGPLDPEAAAEAAAAAPAERIPQGEGRFAAMEEAYGGLRTLAQVALPGATRRPTATPATPPPPPVPPPSASPS